MNALLALIATALAADPAALDAFVARHGQKPIDEHVVMGLVVGTYDRGSTHVAGFGKLAEDREGAPNGQTVYELASLTKIFTGILLADAVERGEMKLNDLADDYLPDDLKLPKHEDRSIELLHIAAHNSGLPRMPDNFRPADWNNPYVDYTHDNLVEFLRGHTLRRAPGSQYEYSNLAYGILGQMLERKTGQTYEALVAERICRPLGLRETSIALDEAARARLAAPFDAALKPAANWDMPLFLGGGALRSTADDMLVFLAANLSPAGSSLTAAIRAAQTPRGDTTIGPDVKMGLGWHLNTTAGTMFHSGQTGGYHTFIAGHAGKQIGVVVLANTATEKIDDLAVKILVRLLRNAE